MQSITEAEEISLKHVATAMRCRKNYVEKNANKERSIPHTTHHHGKATE